MILLTEDDESEEDEFDDEFDEMMDEVVAEVEEEEARDMTDEWRTRLKRTCGRGGENVLLKWIKNKNMLLKKIVCYMLRLRVKVSTTSFPQIRKEKKHILLL